MQVARRFNRTVVVLGCLVALACASAGGSGSRAAVDEAPRMISRVMPDLRLSTPPSGPAPVRLSIEVEVDESGRADVSTLKLMGAGVSDNQHAIRQWLQQALFAPARQNGVPVRGVYKTSLEVRVGVRRIRGG